MTAALLAEMFRPATHPPAPDPGDAWRQERSLMLHLAAIERDAVLAAGGTPGLTRS